MKWTISQRNDIYFVNIITEKKWVSYTLLNQNTFKVGNTIVEIPEFLPKVKGTIYNYYHEQEKDVITIVYIPFSAGNMPKEILNSQSI